MKFVIFGRLDISPSRFYDAPVSAQLAPAAQVASVPRPKIMLITSTLLARRKLEKPDRSRFKKISEKFDVRSRRPHHRLGLKPSQPRAHLFLFHIWKTAGTGEREATRGINNAFCVYPSIVCS